MKNELFEMKNTKESVKDKLENAKRLVKNKDFQNAVIDVANSVKDLFGSFSE